MDSGLAPASLSSFLSHHVPGCDLKSYFTPFHPKTPVLLRCYCMPWNCLPQHEGKAFFKSHLQMHCSQDVIAAWNWPGRDWFGHIFCPLWPLAPYCSPSFLGSLCQILDCKLFGLRMYLTLCLLESALQPDGTMQRNNYKCRFCLLKKKSWNSSQYISGHLNPLAAPKSLTSEGWDRTVPQNYFYFGSRKC